MKAPFLLVQNLFALSYALSSNLTSQTATQTDSSSGSSSSTTSVTTTSLVSTSFLSNASSTSLTFTSTSTSTAVQPTQTLSPGTAGDIETIHARRLDTIVGAITDATNISTWLATQNTDPNSSDLGKWPDVDYTTGCAAQRANWPAEVHWNRLLIMAGAWHGGVEGAEQYVQDPVIQSAISIGMDWWFIRDFTNLACLDSGGTPACPCNANETKLFNTNWFSNIIGIPELVSATCLLVNDTLSSSQFSNCTHMTGRAYATFDTEIDGLGELTGANTLDVAKIGLDLGMLTLNVTLITDAYQRVHNELQIRTTVAADGIRPDGSFGQHGGLLYNGNYGKDYTNDLLDLELEASQTQFAANATSQTAFATLFDGDRWMIYYNTLTRVCHWDFSALGRFISFPVVDDQATASININLTKVAELGEQWGAGVLSTFARTLSKPASSASIGGLRGNRMFYNNDYMVHRGRNYVSTVKMFSTRTRNAECVNSQNPFGFHLADGTLYTYIQGNEYEDIAAAWDWNLIPGITVDYAATPLDCNHTGFAGIENFVGGVSDGRVGIAAMRYTNPNTRSLRFQKAWFLLDDDVQHIMISGIVSNSNAPVYSVLDQRRHTGAVIVNGMKSKARQNYTTGLESLWHGGVGYTFDNANNTLSVQFGEKIGNWSAIGISTQPPPTVDLFAAWITHNTLATPVAYTVFPGSDFETFQLKKRKTVVRTVRNDAAVSAVSDVAHSATMAVFWDAAGGTASFPPANNVPAFNISADGSVAVLFNTKTGDVTVADPAQQLVAVVVTLGSEHGHLLKHWHGEPVKSMIFVLPQGGTAGRSVTQNIRNF